MLQLLKGKQICTFESLGISHFNPNYYLIFPVKSEMKHESVLSQNIVGGFILFLRLLLKPRFIFTWGKCSHLWKYWQNSNSASIWHKSLLSLCAQIDIALVRRLPRLCLTSPFCFPFSLFQSPRMPFNFYLWLCFHCQCSGRGISSIWQLQDALAVLKAALSLTSLRT